MTTLMTMPEVAELAGVQRPVVTNWRRRHIDFPPPVRSDADRVLFDARQVTDWLVSTGRADAEEIEPELSLHTLSRLGDQMAPAALLAAITSLICLRALDDEPLMPEGTDSRRWAEDLRSRAVAADPDDALVQSEILALSDDVGRLAAAADSLVEAAWGCRQALERFLAARHRLKIAPLYVDALAPEAARLMAGLSGAREQAEQSPAIRVADPAAGSGDLLAAVLDELPEYCAPAVDAVEADSQLARLIRRRLIVRGIPEGDISVWTSPSALLDDAPLPHAVVTRLPYVPREDRAEAEAIDAIARIADDLPPHATAVVLGPADAMVAALPPHRPAARLRNALLAAGQVEAVISLPGGLLPYRPGYQPALWVLRRGKAAKWQGRVLLADVSDRALTSEVVDDLVTDVATWRREGYRPEWHSRAFASQADVRDLLAPRTPLTARRQPSLRDLRVGASETIARVAELEAGLDRSAHSAPAFPRLVRSGLAVRRGPAPWSISIGDLAKAGRVAVLRGTRLAAGDVSKRGSHPVIGAPEAVAAAEHGDRMIDRGVLAEKYPRAVLTEPGDVVVTDTPRLGVLVDDLGYSVVEFPARILRIPTSERDSLSPRVLAALLAASSVGARPKGAVRAPARLAERRVTVLGPDESDRLDALLADLDERRRRAQAEIAALDELGRIATAGLTDGTLAIAPTARSPRQP